MRPGERRQHQHCGRVRCPRNWWVGLCKGLGILALMPRILLAGWLALLLTVGSSHAYWQSRDSNYNKSLVGSSSSVAIDVCGTAGLSSSAATSINYSGLTISGG